MIQNTADNPSPEASSQASKQDSFDAKKIWRLIAPKLLNLVTVTTLLTVAGFFVIHSYLASVSRLFTFNISLTQYLAAGVNMVLAIFWNYILPVIIGGLILALIFIGLYFFGRYCLNRSKRVHTLWVRVLSIISPLYQRLRPLLRAAWVVYQVFAWVLFGLLVIGVALIYGTYYYAQSPRMFGGGMPSNVILVFREEQPTQSSIWGFPINTSNPCQSDEVQLLIELTDGVIVRDTGTNRTTIVKNDVLQGIIDVDATSSNLTNIPTTFPKFIGTPTP